MEEFKQGFIEEALELTGQLEELLLNLENRKALDADIQEIFRVMHTIKGSSSMFNFNNTERVSHLVEDVFHQVRDEQLDFNKDILILAVDAVDILNFLLSHDDTPDQDHEKKIDDITGRALSYLPSILEELGTESIESANQDVSQNKAAPNYFYIFFKPDYDILQRGIAPIGVFEELYEYGQVTGFPYLEEVPLVEDYDPTGFFIGWDIFIKTDESQADIEDCFMFYLENEYKVISINPENIAKNNEFLSTCLNMNRGDLTIDQVKQKLNSTFALTEKTDIDKKNDEPKKLTDPIIKDKEKDTKYIESIKVESKKLDELINLVSDLVTLNSKLEIQTSKLEDDQLKKTVNAVSKLSKRFRDNALELRLIPVKVLILKLQRLIRDLSKTLNKEIEFITEGTHTELDKNIIAKLEAPLMHILRNCIDHGIESPEERINAGKPQKGVIRFIAFYSGSNVFIQIQDDGKGMDINHIVSKAIDKGLIDNKNKIEKGEVFNLLFEPGFSTAENITNVSGRGVGLDVVKKEITEMRGEIDIESEKGLGTSFTLKLPLTLSIIDTLMAKVGKTYILFPREFVVQTSIYRNNSDKDDDNYEFENKIIPIIRLRNDFDFDKSAPNKQYDIIVRQYDNYYIIRVDQIIGEHQAVVKPLGHYSQGHEYFSGASILGDGSLAFILDINKVINLKKNRSGLGQYNIK